MSNSKTLAKNCLKNFILRIDFHDSTKMNEIASAIASLFVRREEREVEGYTMRFNPARGDIMPAVIKEKITQSVFVKNDGTVLVISPFDRSIVINASKYEDNSLYSEIVNRISSVEWHASRIGLRYVNVFDCPKAIGIGKILNAPYSEIVKKLSSVESTNRAISVQYRDCHEENMIKIQFGVSNDAFPSAFRNYNILLDIDSFHVGDVGSNESVELISKLNHNAYDVFMEFVTPRQIESMK